jgi:hypothetical protein
VGDAIRLNRRFLVFTGENRAKSMSAEDKKNVHKLLDMEITSSLGKGLDIRKSASHWSFMQCVLLGAFVVAAGYFVWIVGEAQTMGVWAEIQSFFPIVIKF